MDQLSCMRVFVRVVEQGALSRAADDLAISRTSVTTALSQLEKKLGVRLLNRTTRRLSLTEEGSSYYKDCVRILGEIAEAEDSLTSAKSSPRGCLRVSIPQSFEALSFFPLLREFMKQHPVLRVEVIVTDRAVNLVEEGMDCALRAVEIPPDSVLVARKLVRSMWLTCASPGYLAEKGTPLCLADLPDHNCIRFVSPSSCRVRDWAFDIDGTRSWMTPGGNLSVTSLDGAVAAARTGEGIVQVPVVLAFQAVMDGELQPLLTAHIAEGVSLMLTYPGNRYLPAKVRAFARFFENAYPKEGWWPKIAAKLEAEGRTAA